MGIVARRSEDMIECEIMTEGKQRKQLQQPSHDDNKGENRLANAIGTCYRNEARRLNNK